MNGSEQDGSRISEQGLKHFPFPHYCNTSAAQSRFLVWARVASQRNSERPAVRQTHEVPLPLQVPSTSSKTFQCDELCISDRLLTLRLLWHSYNNSRMDPSTRGPRREQLWRNRCSDMWQEQHPRNATSAWPFPDSQLYSLLLEVKGYHDTLTAFRRSHWATSRSLVQEKWHNIFQLGFSFFIFQHSKKNDTTFEVKSLVEQFSHYLTEEKTSITYRRQALLLSGVNMYKASKAKGNKPKLYVFNLQPLLQDQVISRTV